MRSRIDRLDLPAGDARVAQFIAWHKALARAYWEVQVLVVSHPPARRGGYRRDVALIGMAWQPTLLSEVAASRE